MKVVFSMLTAAIAAAGFTSASAADALYVDSNTVRQVQKTLNDRGFRTGGVDGRMGPQTQAALVNFQRAEKLLIIFALNKERGVKLRAAKILGINRVTLDRKLVEYGIHVKRGKGVVPEGTGDGDDGDRVRLSDRGQPRSLERVDGYIDFGRVAVPDLLAVEEHRRLVLLPLADDDDALHGDGVEHRAHGVDGRLVGGLLVAAPDPARAAERGGLGHADELEREVPVGCDAVAASHGLESTSARAPRPP